MIGKAQMYRLLELDWQIRTRRYPNAPKFAEEYHVCAKTTFRDIEYLRDTLGGPLAYDTINGGYFYEETWEPPWLLVRVGLQEQEELLEDMDPDDPARAALVARREALHATYRQFQARKDPFVPYKEQYFRAVIRSLKGVDDCSMPRKPDQRRMRNRPDSGWPRLREAI